MTRTFTCRDWPPWSKGGTPVMVSEDGCSCRPYRGPEDDELVVGRLVSRHQFAVIELDPTARPVEAPLPPPAPKAAPVPAEPVRGDVEPMWKSSTFR